MGGVFGQMWDVQTSGTTNSIECVRVISSQVVWASGLAGTILKTDDGGNNWVAIAPPLSGFDFHSMEALDAKTAWVAGTPSSGLDFRIWKTVDGGTTWVLQFRSAESFGNAVRFYDANNGIVFGDPETSSSGHYLVLRTTNGGTNWTRISRLVLPAADSTSGEVGLVNAFDNYNNQAWFTTYVTSATSTLAPRVYRSTNRGLTWTSSARIAGLNRGANISFKDELNGLMTDIAEGKGAQTTDGGVTWRVFSIDPLLQPSSVQWIRGTNSVVVVGRSTTGGRAVRSTDGGDTWLPMELPEGVSDLRHVHFIDPRTGWAVGKGGTILRWAAGPLLTSVTVRVWSPNGGEIWNEDLRHWFFWESGDALGNPITKVQMYFSSDNGTTYSLVFDNLTNQGYRSWRVPRVPTTGAMVKVVAFSSAGETSYDESDAPFTIVDVNTYVHRTGTIAHTIRNDGFTGSGSATFDPAEPSLEFPPGSRLHHLYVGQLLLAGVTPWGDSLANLPYDDSFVPMTPIVATTRANSVDTRSRFQFKDIPEFEIEQFTIAPSNESYVLFGFKIFNGGSFKFSDAFLGFYGDFDLNDATKNRCGYERVDKLAYTFDPSGGWKGYAGVRMLNVAPTSFRRWGKTVPEPVNTTGDWYRAVAKLGNDDPSGDSPEDYRIMESVGPFSLAPGDSASIVIALAVGDGLAGLQSSALRAQQLWDYLSSGPTVTTNAASSVSTTAATLNATVDPKGISTTVIFRYGTTTSYGSQVAAAGGPFTTTGPISVSANITGLTPGTVYHYQAVATNSTGTVSGSDQSFTTLSTGTIAVTSTPTVWATAYTYPVTWTSSNVTGNVNIRLSTNGGSTYTTILSNAPNTGSASVPIPASTSASTNCKLRVESIVNASLGGESGIFTIVSGTLPTTMQLSSTVTFGSDVTASTSYRLVSLPGNVGSLSVSQIVTGTQKTDWRMYSDNGASSNFLVELSGGSTLGVGQGYWLLKRGSLSISRSVSAVSLGSDATYAISLHSGWNIIGNPFDKNVAWSAILTANGITATATTRIQEYTGSYATATTLEPYEGYYYFNSGNLSSLKIPYPFGGKIQPDDLLPPVDWKIQLAFASDINQDVENFVGIAPAAKEGYDDLESRKPPLFMDQGFLYFERPDWDKTFSFFGSDFRPSLGEGQVWEFSVRNPRRSAGTIRFSGVDRVPNEYEVKLVNLSNTVPVNLRTSSEYSYRPTEEVTGFKLLVGKRSFVESELASIIPQEFELLQNFPNPFNSSTTIMFKVPSEAHVQLEVLSLLGQRVKTLVDERLTAGTYSAAWDGTDKSGTSVASGVYFYRLVREGNPVHTKKLTILK